MSRPVSYVSFWFSAARVERRRFVSRGKAPSQLTQVIIHNRRNASSCEFANRNLPVMKRSRPHCSTCVHSVRPKIFPCDELQSQPDSTGQPMGHRAMAKQPPGKTCFGCKSQTETAIGVVPLSGIVIACKREQSLNLVLEVTVSIGQRTCRVSLPDRFCSSRSKRLCSYWPTGRDSQRAIT